MRKLQRGAVLIDMIMGLLVSFLVGAVIMSALQTSVSSRTTINTQNDVQTDVRKPIDLMADHLRNAQLNSSIAIALATATSITYYSDSAGSMVSYYLDGDTLMRTEGDINATPTAVLTGVTALQFTYYKNTSGYNQGSIVACASPTAPISTELRFLSAVQIDATVMKDGYSANYSTLVRLRNSPKKSSL